MGWTVKGSQYGVPVYRGTEKELPFLIYHWDPFTNADHSQILTRKLEEKWDWEASMLNSAAKKPLFWFGLIEFEGIAPVFSARSNDELTVRALCALRSIGFDGEVEA